MKEKERGFDELMIEFRNIGMLISWLQYMFILKIERKTDEEIGEMRLKLRMKTDEAERVRHLYEDNLVVVKEHKLDIERQK